MASAPVAIAAPLEPDLRVLPPRHIALGSDPGTHDNPVLHFTNTVFNAGPGRFELHDDTGHGTATQWIFDSDGTTHTTHSAGALTSDSFTGWVKYELWTRTHFDSSEPPPLADRTAVKDAGCVIDEEPVLEPAEALGPMPWPGSYADADPGCQSLPVKILGLSPGWGDTFDYYHGSQAFDLGSAPLPDGDYVLRSTVDPNGSLEESSTSNNSSTVRFTISGGIVQDFGPASGTIVIDRAGAKPNGDLVIHVVGRDDTGGAKFVRFSNDGSAWGPAQAYADSNTDLAPDAPYWSDFAWNAGATPGTHTVFAQFDDGAGTWTGPVASDSVVIPAAPAPPASSAPAPLPPSPGGTGSQVGTQSNPIAPISRLLARPSKFRATRTRRAKHGGTTFRFTLSQAGRLTITIERNTQVAAKRRYRSVGTLRVSGRAGANAVRFRGWIGHRKLKPGRYRAVVRFVHPPAGAKARTVAFRIKP